jgi:hypothetical protein
MHSGIFHKAEFSFILTEGAIYICFMIMDFFPSCYFVSSCFKYAAVVICFLSFIKIKDPIITLGQFSVVIADFFLLFTGYNETGIIFYLLVHLCYFFHISHKQSWLIAAPILCSLIGYIYSGSAIIGLVGSYAVITVINIIRSVLAHKKVFSAGLVLLCCCDTCVLFFNMSLHIEVLSIILPSFFPLLMWMFYLPSQILITLDSFIKK